MSIKNMAKKNTSNSQGLMNTNFNKNKDVVSNSYRRPKIIPLQMKEEKELHPWWYHLLYGNSSKIHNNEAVLYLSFMKNTCLMLLLCSIMAIIIHSVVFAYAAMTETRYFLMTYSYDDLLNSELTVWSLYVTTWIYSIIVYLYIFKFRNNINVS